VERRILLTVIIATSFFILHFKEQKLSKFSSMSDLLALHDIRHRNISNIRRTFYMFEKNGVHLFFIFYFLQIYNLLYNGAISKYVVRKHLCGAIIQ
jgi:hypothetical protein